MLEIISTNKRLKIKNIFLDNDNWFKFYIRYSHLLRPTIIENVVKLLSCKTSLLGYHLYSCPNCSYEKKIPHSCKSRFCSSCGKVANDNWINKALNTLPDVRYQHITFTMPSEYWDLFRINRNLLNAIPRIAAHVVLDICKQSKKRKRYLPGIFLVLHSFGRNLKFNVHIHLNVTYGGFIIKNNKVSNKYIDGSFIKDSVIKNMWKYQITTLLRTSYKKHLLKPYPAVAHHFINFTVFNKWLNSHYQKTWNVFLQHSQQGAKSTISYLGRYLKRPPLAESRIIAYDEISVTFRFHDHYSNTDLTQTLPIIDFIKTLIIHIPDKFFKMIRYYGFLANRVRAKYLKSFKKNISPLKNHYLSYLKRFLLSFNSNPLRCRCGSYLQLSEIVFALSISTLLQRHSIKAGYLSDP